MVLTVLYPTKVEGARDEDALSVDIVAVHGLNGAPLSLEPTQRPNHFGYKTSCLQISKVLECSFLATTRMQLSEIQQQIF